MICSDFSVYVAHCWIIPVVILFRLSISCDAILFSVRSKTRSSFSQLIWGSTFVCVLLFRSFLRSALFSETEPITTLWSLPMLRRLNDGHVCNRARCVSHGVVYFIFSVSIPSWLLHVHLLPAFFWSCVFMIFNLFDVAHSTRVSPLSFRRPRQKSHVALSGVFVCPPTCTLKSPITIV